MAVLTLATITSPTAAVVFVDRPITRMHWIVRAPVLSATFRRVWGWITKPAPPPSLPHRPRWPPPARVPARPRSAPRPWRLRRRRGGRARDGRRRGLPPRQPPPRAGGR